MEAPTNIRFLKWLVIGLSIAILLSGAIVIATMISRSTNDGTNPRATSVRASSASFEAKRLELPKGSRVIELRTDSGRMILRVRQLGGNEQILILDLATGNQIGEIDVEAAE